MMKTNFTNYLKIKWRLLIPLFCFGIISVQSAYADCDVEMENAVLTLSCDGRLSIDFTDAEYEVVSLQAEGLTEDGMPSGTETSFRALPFEHATGFWASESEFSLEVECRDAHGNMLGAKSFFQVGDLPEWDLSTGVGAGRYVWDTLNGEWDLDQAFTSDGNVYIDIYDKAGPWCPDSTDGYVKVAIRTKDIDPKCADALFRLTIDGVEYDTVRADEIVTFDSLGAGMDTVSAEVVQYSCPCMFDGPEDEKFTLHRQTGTTTSMACVADINLSMSDACKACLRIEDVLLGSNDPCAGDMMAMVDSIAILGPHGEVLATGSGSDMGLVCIENAEIYLGKKLKVSVFSLDRTGVDNSCWGHIHMEDKTPPRLTCEDPGPTEILCLEYEGSPEKALEKKIQDCGGKIRVNVITEKTLDECDEIDDHLHSRVVVRYNVTDYNGRTSQTCEDSLDILRFDTVPDNGMLDIPGYVWMPHHFVTSPDTGMRFMYEPRRDDDPYHSCHPHHYYETYPLQCTNDGLSYEPKGEGAVEPAPIDYAEGGSGYPILKWINSDGDTVKSPLLPNNYMGDDEYQAIVRKNYKNCRIGVHFEDKTWDWGCKTKIERKWFLTEWSCGTSREQVQIICLGVQDITIADHEAPVFSDKVDDKKMSVGAFDCYRNEYLDYPGVHDNCDSDIEIRAAVYDTDWNLISGTFSNRDPHHPFYFPPGRSYIVYKAADDCDNEAIDTSMMDVVDETPPVAICKEFLAVGLTGEYSVRVPAKSFDNGSFDGCDPHVKVCAVRMDDLDLFKSMDKDKDGKVLYKAFSDSLRTCGRDYYYEYAHQDPKDGEFWITEHELCSPYIELCCEDNMPAEGETEAEDVMVLFKAIDYSGNVNSCMVFVDVQDKRVPEIYCLPDVLIDCDFELPEYDSAYADMSDDPLSELFGDIVAPGEEQAWGIADSARRHYILPHEGFDDPHHPDADYADIEDMVDGVYADNCNTPMIPVTIKTEIDNCGFGYIKRTYYATDGTNKSRHCEQIIRIFRNEVDPGRIVWPNDTTINACTTPGDLMDQDFGKPEVVGDDCSLIGKSQEDQIFTFHHEDQETDACFKIVRRYTIIDWCQSTKKGGQPFILGEHTQIIKVIDPDAPTITCADSLEVLTNECEDELMFMATAEDSCSTDLKWSATLEYLDREGNVTNTEFLEESDLTIDSTGKATYTRTLPIGHYRMIWNVADRCGNEDSCEQFGRIINIKKPTPWLTNVSTALMNTNGMVTIWAEDFDRKSTHPCYDDDLIRFAIVHQGEPLDTSSTSLTFTCDDAIDNYIDFYAFLVVDGQLIYEFTTVKLKVSDNGVCTNDRPQTSGTGQSAFIAGNIRTESGSNIPNIAVDLLGGNQGAAALEAVYTDIEGLYAFPGMSEGGAYTVVPSTSDDDYLKGVTTFDLVLIQKYVLGLYEMESPYQLIAADVNNDGDISAIDLVELRKVILGFKNEFENNDSWRFVDATYEFSNPKTPLAEKFPEHYRISELKESMEIDFIGLKVADINGSADASSVVAKGRSTHTLIAKEQVFGSGEMVQLDLMAGRDISVAGTQMTIEFDPQKLEFTGVTAGAMSIRAEHVGTRDINNGILSLSWNDTYDIVMGEDDVIFTISFRARKSGKLSKAVALSSVVVNSEIYSSDLEISNLSLKYERDEMNLVTEEAVLYQNTPNPFAEETTISFYLPEAANATLTIHDVTGKTMRKFSGSFDKGLNNISVSTDELAGVGVMYFTLATDRFVDTKRMVVLR